MKHEWSKYSVEEIESIMKHSAKVAAREQMEKDCRAICPYYCAKGYEPRLVDGNWVHWIVDDANVIVGRPVCAASPIREANG